MSFSTPKQRSRDWVLLLAIFLLGLVFMLLTGTLAIGLAPQWTVKASMNSMLNPNAQYVSLKSTQIVIEPVLPAILTPPTWQAIYQTPQKTSTRGHLNATATSKSSTKTQSAGRTSTPVGSPQVTATRTAQVTPSKTFIVFLPSWTPKPKTSTPKPSQTFTPTITRTATKTATSTRTATFTKTATSTKTMTPTRTFTPTITLTPTITATPTITLTRTFTHTPTVTLTSTRTLTPTVTLTPTETLTPTITLTPTVTPTPTTDPINWGPGDGNWINLSDGGSMTFTISPAITGHSNSVEDFVYYERATGPTSIQLDHVLIEISQDGSNWYPVFNWGDDISDTNTNMDFVARGFGSEADNQNVSGGMINGYGIGIDIYSLGLTGSYPYLRISCPGGGGDGCDLDGFEIYP